MLSVFLRMTKNITKVIYEKEKMMLETAALFISSCYAPWALMSYMVAKAPSNVLSAIKSAFQIKDHYPRLRQALLAGMQHHFWNLPDDLVLLALADDDTELELKSKTSWLWSSCLFKIGKPDLPALRCQESWVIWWSIQLASLESGWCSQRGGGEV